MPLDPFVLLSLSAPFSFLLPLYESSTIVTLRAIFCPVLIYVSVKGLAVYLIFFKGTDVLVQLFLAFRVGCFVKSVRVREIGSVELKVRWVVD